ncbi:MAG: pyridoxamine 5'-phosphate oxidase family protein [Armatimonadia bacterium]|nr:pyridoxamine 5'-phosphate oxidase family protein [Armatimonadia bacterium]
MQPEDGPAITSEASHPEAKRILRELLATERLGVLSTHHAGAPYASLVAFVASEDLRRILFATPRATRKFANIEADPRVAMLIDNARHLPVDFEHAAGATATGEAVELRGEERAEAADRFGEAHPYLREFVASPSTALMCIEVDSYYVVRRFQHVTELHLNQ